MGDECGTCGAPVGHTLFDDLPINFDDSRYVNDIETLRTRVGDLESMIDLFCKGSEWAWQPWQAQKHVSPLFADHAKRQQDQGDNQ